MPKKEPRKIAVFNAKRLDEMHTKLASFSGNTPLSYISAFPDKTSFNGQNEDEYIVLIVRQHPVVLIPQAIAIVGVLILSVLFPAGLRLFGISGGSIVALTVGSFLFFLTIAVTLGFSTFVRWFYSVHIITNERIVDVTFKDVMSHSFSETRLSKVQDVTHKVVGALSSIFDLGNLYVQTAGETPEFVFENIPRPREVQEVILDLIDAIEERPH